MCQFRRDLGQVLPMELDEKLHCDSQGLGEFHSSLECEIIHYDCSAKVVIGDLDIKGAEKVVAAIKKMGRCTFSFTGFGNVVERIFPYTSDMALPNVATSRTGMTKSPYSSWPSQDTDQLM